MSIIIEILFSIVLAIVLAAIIICFAFWLWHFSHRIYDANGRNISWTWKGIKLYFRKH